MKPEEIRQLLAIAQSALPAANEIVETAKQFGKILGPLFRGLTVGIADARADAFHHYVSRGLTREEALQMAVADAQNLREALRSRKS